MRSVSDEFFAGGGRPDTKTMIEPAPRAAAVMNRGRGSFPARDAELQSTALLAAKN